METGENLSELRGRQWIKGEHGYFAGSVSTGGGGSAGGAKSGKGLYSNGGSKGNSKIDLTNFLNDATITDKESVFKQYLKNGQVNTTVEKSQQQKHQATKVWKNQVKQALNSNGKITPRNLLNKNIDPQKFVNKYSGTGNFYFPKGNIIVNKFIKMNYIVGRTYDKKLKKYIPTDVIQIKYTKNGVHIFPTISNEV